MYSRPSPAELNGLTGSSSVVTIKSYTDYSLPFDASWEPDFWGRVRSTVRANVYAAQASAADLENVRLSEQAELAVDYYELRAQDSLKQLLDSTVVAYQETLDLTQSQYRAGLTNDEAVAQAEAQLKATQAQDINLGVLRAQYEHAIAVLIGQPASTFSLPAQALEGKTSSNARRRSVRTSRAASGHRRSGAQCRPSQRPDWRGEGRVFSQYPIERFGWVWKFFVLQLVHVAKPLLVGRAEPCGNNLRCGIAPGHGPAVSGEL